MNVRTEAVNLPRVYSIKQAAKLAGVSDMTLYNAIKAGLLRAIRLTGKEQSIRHEDLRAWLNGETQPRSAGQVMKNPNFLDFFKNAPQLADFIKNLPTNTTDPTQEKKIKNE